MQSTLKSAMTKNLKTIHELENLESAFAMMMKFNVRHLPVCNENGDIVGILSDRDLQRAMQSEVKGEGSFREETCVFDPKYQVCDYMSWPVKTIDINEHLKIVTEKLLHEKVSCYLITDQKQVVGIITTDDLLKILSALLEENYSTTRLEIANILANPNIGRFAQIISDSGI